MFKILEKVEGCWLETSGMNRGQFLNPYKKREEALKVAAKVARLNGSETKVIIF